ARPEFYQEIQTELDDCDVVFFEGVRGRVTRWITLVYRIPTWFFSRTGLVEQNKQINLSARSDRAFEKFARGLGPVVKRAARRLSRTSRRSAGRMTSSGDFTVSGSWPQAVWTAVDSGLAGTDVAARRLVHADMTEEMFNEGWKRVDWATRLAIIVLCPLFGIGLAFSQRLRKWAFDVQHDMDLDEETKELDDFMRLVLYERDKVMIGKIEAFWDAEPEYTGQAAGLFGAAHLPAIINHLVEKRRFQIVSSRWVMAIPAE
ncbi:MAG: TraB/GumN family protein, partial [Hyphomicrobiales bacterium]|nr:TraB/GumN family protein [Hyphomicrobiales bacterium]